MGLEMAMVFRKEGRAGLREKVTCEQRLAGGEGVHSTWERRGRARNGSVPRISETRGAGARSEGDRVTDDSRERRGSRTPKTL